MRHRCRHHLAHALERTQQTSLLRLRPPPLNRCSGAQRCYATPATHPDEAGVGRSRSLSLPSEARYNEIGVQHVSKHVHDQLFPVQSRKELVPVDKELVELSKKHLVRHDLLGKTSDDAEPIAFDLPALKGATLDEHFYRLGMDSAETYLDLSNKYARASPPPKPRSWERRSGWTKYHPDGTSEPIAAPDADMLTFDVEVMWHETSFPAMACAVSGTNWYAWLSPWLLGESESDRHLIPLGDPNQARVIVGHNIGYDRARILEEYSLQQSKNFFMDTMSLHVAVNGMCSRQRPNWMKARKAREFQDRVAESDEHTDLAKLLQNGEEGMEEEEELWVGRSSANSLRDVARFHCGITIDKAKREWFGELDREGVMGRLDELLDYCAADVEVTHKVYKKVFPAFLKTCPHPVSFAALRHLGTEILPVDKGWEAYIKNAEATYQRLSTGVEERLVGLAEKALEHKGSPKVYEQDPWLRQLNWIGQEIRMTKPKKKGEQPRMAKGQKKPGMPKWYKELFARDDSRIALTVRTRIAPLLLRLAWDGHPLVWSDKYGWTFRISSSSPTGAGKYAGSMTECDMSEESNERLRDDVEATYFKLPHVDGPNARCANPLAKGYLQYFESGTLGSEYAYAKEALEMNASCSYWISARDRIMSQMVVYNSELPTSSTSSTPAVGSEDEKQGFILPQIIPMGTITRRAVENTWLTASNAKKNRVGSELKSIITAPPGYVFVGADVDSEELWIASLAGDASFKLHGGNAIGFMTLEGTKAAGTDLHSRTAKILGISRGDAKVFNYGRIYGAGMKFAQSLLRRFNPALTEEQATDVAKKLYTETKGAKAGRKLIRDRQFWYGGTESLVFNRLEDFAEQERPRTPVLGAGITEALMRRFLGQQSFLTSRINWAIQSSGVDYLHLLVVSMDYLTRRYGIQARLALTVHDEIRYLAKEEDKYRCAMALQVANVWTRAMFSQQMGIDDLPQSCAYFSAVDIDHVLRKEVDMDCVTPSHPNAIPPGESVDIAQLLAKGKEARLDPDAKLEGKGLELEVPRPERFAYTPREPVMEELRTENAMHYLRAQVAGDKKEVHAIAQELRPKAISSKPFNDDPKPAAAKRQTSKQPRTTSKKASNAKTASAIAAGTMTTQTQAPLKQYKQAPNLLAVDMPLDEPRWSTYSKYYVQAKEKNRKAWEGRSTAWNVGLMGQGQGRWPQPQVPARVGVAGARH